MTRDEYLIVLATEPATPCQRGRIMAECARLGIGDRAERLATCAQIAGLAGLASTHDLTMGDAGRIVKTLQNCRDRNELDPAAAPVHQHAGNRMTLAEALQQVAELILHWLDGPPGSP